MRQREVLLVEANLEHQQLCDLIGLNLAEAALLERFLQDRDLDCLGHLYP